MNTAAAARRLRDQPVERWRASSRSPSGENGSPRFSRLRGEAHQVAVHHVAGVLEVGGEDQDLASGAPMVGLGQRLRIERGEIGLDRGVQLVEHVVQALGVGDAPAVGAVQRVRAPVSMVSSTSAMRSASRAAPASATPASRARPSSR